MIHARGGVPLAVPACLTVQNRFGVRSVQRTAADLLAAMTAAALEDGPVHAVKVGMLADSAAVEEVTGLLEPLRQRGVPIVVDPVFSATAGGWEAQQELIVAYRQHLAPRATVLTPNIPELELLAGGDPASVLASGCDSLLVKGGHGVGTVVEDRLWTGSGEVVFRHPRLDLGPVHGTGCALASALACSLGAGLSVEDACRIAITTVGRCLAATTPAADGAAAPLAVV